MKVEVKFVKILCSACLLGERCKYNGGHNFSQSLIDWIAAAQQRQHQDNQHQDNQHNEQHAHYEQYGPHQEHQYEQYQELVEVIPVCPEILGGLPTPRVPAEIVNGVVINREGQSVDKEFRLGAQKALQIALAERVDIAILQSRSPSCGVNEIYDGSFTGKRIKGSGIFATVLKTHGIRVFDVADIENVERMKDMRI